jgi:hypothetical protein
MTLIRSAPVAANARGTFGSRQTKVSGVNHSGNIFPS